MQPKLGRISSQWGRREGQPVLILQNSLGLISSAIALPATLSMLPLLCDGTRDISALRASLMVRAGVRISDDVLVEILRQMDEALLFDSERLQEATAQALRAYRDAAHRRPVSADASYPCDPTAAASYLNDLIRQAGPGPEFDGLPPIADLRAIVSPHIDYLRGGSVYARTWHPAREAVCAADLVVILGTDHHGPAGSITLTRQRYRTPWGVLETDGASVERVAAALGDGVAFEHELHHSIEHSIELAAVWLQYVSDGASFSVLPVLCGSFAPFIEGCQRAEDDEALNAAISEFRAMAMEGRRVLFVAAVDLAHMGPAFEGPPVSLAERAVCRQADEQLLATICAGDGPAFLAHIQAERDRRNVCGVPPLYLLLQILRSARGVATGYEQCRADGKGTSIVSIAGALLW